MNIPKNAGKVSDVTLKRIPHANTESKNGKMTFEFFPWNGKEVEFINPMNSIFFRKKGESKPHCHHGTSIEDPERNPEQILFIQAKVNIVLEDLWGNKSTLKIRVAFAKPVVLTIPPWVLHTFKYKGETVYEEMRRRPYPKNNEKEQDIVLEEEFRTKQKEIMGR